MKYGYAVKHNGIFYAAGQDVPDENSDSGEIGDMTVKELRAYAEEKKIDLGKATAKADIIAVIEAAESESGPPQKYTAEQLSEMTIEEIKEMAAVLGKEIDETGKDDVIAAFLKIQQEKE